MGNDPHIEELIGQSGSALPPFKIGRVVGREDKHSAEIVPQNGRSIFHVRLTDDEVERALMHGIREQLRRGLGDR